MRFFPIARRDIDPEFQIKTSNARFAKIKTKTQGKHNRLQNAVQYAPCFRCFPGDVEGSDDQHRVSFASHRVTLCTSWSRVRTPVRIRLPKKVFQ